jgi:GTP-binding protein
LKITAEFVTSAADAAGLPADGLPEVAMVGRSNVGKSSLINALVRQRVARTSAAPGKTRLANVYRVVRGAWPPFYLVDLPGYGYARGRNAAAEFNAVTAAYFEQVGQVGLVGRGGQTGNVSSPPAPSALLAVLLVDARHAGLENDLAAWEWVKATVAERAIVATKIDKLARGQRIRALGELESVFDSPVVPVSAVTGEGLDELWKLIDRLASRRRPQPHSNPSNTRQKAMAPRPPTLRPRSGPAPSKIEGPRK